MRALLPAILTVLALTTSCETVRKKRNDTSMRAVEASYPSAIFTVQDKAFNGSGEVRIPLGEDLATLRLRVQGVGNGTIKVDSKACNISQSFTYLLSKSYLIPLDGVATKSCFISIVVQPENSEAEYHGTLLVKAIPYWENWRGFSDKVPVGSFAERYVKLHKKKEALVVFRGCGTDYEDMVEPNEENLISLTTAEIIPFIPPEGMCSLEGAVVQDGTVIKVSWSIHYYNQHFSPLPIPVIDLLATGLATISFDETIEHTLINGILSDDLEAVMKFDYDRPEYFSAYTSKGRSVLCAWSPIRTTWRCSN